MTQHQPHEDDYQEKIEKMATMTVAAARGIVPVGQVALPLAQIANGDLAPPEARRLARALLDILGGEREAATLSAALPAEFVGVVEEVLDQIEAPLPEPGEEDRIGLTLEELLEKVAEACTGEALLWQRLWNFTEELYTDESLPANIRRLGMGLRKILAGERQKQILDELSPEHRWAVAQLLDWLSARALEPESTAGPISGLTFDETDD